MIHHVILSISRLVRKFSEPSSALFHLLQSGIYMRHNSYLCWLFLRKDIAEKRLVKCMQFTFLFACNQLSSWSKLTKFRAGEYIFFYNCTYALQLWPISSCFRNHIYFQMMHRYFGKTLAGISAFTSAALWQQNSTDCYCSICKLAPK